jgi:hypothetical protein
MRFIRLAALIASFGLLSGQAPAPKYAQGQIWEYKTRPQDAGSLLKIQRIETQGNLPVYHISVIGVHVGGSVTPAALQHLPVSDQTLDASVTRLSQATPDFPTTFEEGISTWREAKGGVFTIPVAEIVDIVDQTIPRSPKS